MARFASEHHPEGPGDAPKRRAGRKRQTKTPSLDLTNGSKRAVPPNAAPAEQHTKRVKRVVVTDEEQISQELQDSVFREEENINVADNSSRREGRRHSEPPVPLPEEESDNAQLATPPSTQPFPGLTPHLERLGASRPTKSNRRSRLSMPAQLGGHDMGDTGNANEVQFAPLTTILEPRVKRRLRRSHLSEEVNEIEEHKKEDVKLKKEYAELLRQLSEKKERIRELEFQAEARRMGEIDMSDDQTKELEDALALARKEIDELKASSVYAGSSEDVNEDFQADMDGFGDDEDMMLVNPHEINVTEDQMETEPHTNGFYAARAIATSSQLTFESLSSVSQVNFDSLTEASQTNPDAVPDKISDQAVRRYESEIEKLTRMLADANAAVRILTIELQNLNIVEPGASGDAIVTELRHTLENAREELEKLFPNTTVDLTNGQLIPSMIEHIQGLMGEIREKVAITEKHNQCERALRTQISGILDLLADFNIRNQDLKLKLHNLDVTNDQNQRRVVELEEQVTAMNEAAEQADKDIQGKDIRIRAMEHEINDKETGLDRLRQAIEGYRQEVTTLTGTVTRLEQEHADRTAQMEHDHAEVVQDLQAHLDNEMEARATAEADAEQKSEFTNHLEGRVHRIQAEFDKVDSDLARLREQLAEEKAGRETAEAELDEKVNILYEREVSIENMRESIQDLQQQLADIQENRDSERLQREAAEADLDQRNEQIEALNTQIRDAGIQANELRHKLWEVQGAKEQTVAKLKEDVKARKAEYQEALSAETQRRKDAEEEITSLETKIAELEQDLQNTEDALAETTRNRDNLLVERDEQVTELEARLQNLDHKYTALQTTSADTIRTLDATIHDLTNTVADQKAEIERLQEETVAAVEEHAAEIADRDATIDGLENEKESLMKENKSLAKRVENEANELLNIVSSHNDEVKALRQVIATHEATIANLQDKAAQRSFEYTEAMAEKTAELEALTLVADIRAADIAALHAQIEETKNAFQIREEEHKSTLETLQEARRQLVEHEDQLIEEQKKRGVDAVRTIMEMNVRGLEVKTNGIDLHKVANGKVTKTNENIKITKKKSGRRTRRQFDSGIGVADDEQTVEME
ncbi:hypothetical protein K469DRAFT_554551 [Zopfia rhizophila CBS 207.26]|uniref:Uncharacterized protein n=1 Tax=Zopfia rhizophila CBS 207.26 TaxID=1314779 RepID=A0A6A6ELC4_9PEZI|nr:hypothetical protein K469DRAFT_554551 [Zopfia rhizophila CBS 207.26]